MRRLSSSSWLSRPVAFTDSTAIDMTTVIITSTTKISTRVKPLLRIAAATAGGLFLLLSPAEDVRIRTFAAGFAVAAVRQDFIFAAIRARARIDIGIAPRILGH